MQKIGLFCGALAIILLSSCRFGRTAEEIRNKYNDVERDLTFTFSAVGPGGTSATTSSTRVILEDDELEGVVSSWEDDDVIALFDFGEVFVATGEGTTNYALPLNYHEDAADEYGIDFAVFTGSARAKMGEDVFNGKPFALLYPYNQFQDQPASTTSVQLDFDGQWGSLNTIQENFLYAWGRAQGICEDAVVTLIEDQVDCSSQQEWHSHRTGSDVIVLDNKMAIIRFSMVVANVTIGDDNQPDTTYMTLNDYLGSDIDISGIEVQNLALGAPGVSLVNLDLMSGMVSPETTATNVLTIGHKNDTTGVQTCEIQEQDATPVNHSVDADSVAWGTTFYLAVPCPTETKLEYHPLITVQTRNNKTGQPGVTYYGAVSQKTIKEGDYYMTAPIVLFDSKARIDVEAKIYLYYHSSYVWGGDDAIDVY
ncbi:MAG: hypothetical protein J6W69_05190 [Bacteroidales bacterium]|nr:hypothetical protein [Bacteroidales bacterium]